MRYRRRKVGHSERLMMSVLGNVVVTLGCVLHNVSWNESDNNICAACLRPPTLEGLGAKQHMFDV